MNTERKPATKFCPAKCPYLVLKNKPTDRCRKGYWRESDPFKKPLYFIQTEPRLNDMTLRVEQIPVAFHVVRPPDCKGAKK